MSGPSSNEEFVVMATRRRWTPAEKRSIMAELLVPGARASAIARKHGVSPSLLFRWRKQFADKAGCGASRQNFVPVMLPPPRPIETLAAPQASSPSIEIELACGRRVKIGEGADLGFLKRVIEALEGK